MNTATALTVDNANLTTPEADLSPLEARWGFQVGQRGKYMSAHECGISLVPYGQLFAIRSFPGIREKHTTDENQPREERVLIPAAECELYLMEALGGQGKQTDTNWGMLTGFVGERDNAKMAVISETLLPKLPTIREIQAEYGLTMEVVEEVCPGTDELDYGRRDECLSCWWNWLNSPICVDHYTAIAEQGMTVNVRDPETGEKTKQIVKPPIEELKKAHDMLLTSARQALKQTESWWKQVVTEFERDDARHGITDYEDLYRKDLHQNKPDEKQFAVAREMAKSVKGAAGNNDALIQTLAEGQIKTQELLQTLVQQQQAKTTKEK